MGHVARITAIEGNWVKARINLKGLFLKPMLQEDINSNKLIVFDFDGVLGDTLDEMLRIAGRVAADLGHACEPQPGDLDALERMEFSELGIQLGIPASQIDEFSQRCFDLFAVMPDPPPIFPGMAQVVHALAMNCRLAVITGNTSRIVNRFLSENGLQACFAMVLGSDSPGNRTERLGRILATLGGAQACAYLIGDAVSDMRVARQAGILSIAVTWGHQSEAHLILAKPDYLVRTPGELLDLLDGNLTGE